jgi:FMN phosphatase YigB (HAD superfamily)
MKQKAAIFDLDGTIANNDHRQHFIVNPEGTKNWDAFNRNFYYDKPNHWCVHLMIAMKMLEYKIIIVSGRSDEFFAGTDKWLETHGIPYDRLFMRKEKDYRPDFEIKGEIYKNEIEPHYEISFCVDDRKQVVDYWRSIGLTCLQCAEGNF